MEIAIGVGILLAYLLGSIPTAVWFGKALHGIDVREHGSGNPGATNTFRVLGKRAGTIVMLGDVIKGMAATSLAVILMNMEFIEEQNLVTFKLIMGVVAVTGHIFSVFINFKGGKGVATLLGMMIAIHYEVALLCIVVFLITLIVSKYVSLASIIGALSFPALLLLVPRFKTNEPLLVIFGFFLFVVIVWTHHKNIRRMMEGEENKTYLLKSKKD
ncbi:Acyl-phosphate:glycerol-3-phosphate O-acyltransferase PlsY [Fulvivirga imtechensis AK7]|uniref:Glycerol-3-phosphate acyltransferase n=1 Tax=Fulvivirga imtechensis AK7 TaxID=1237149 RepID=L8JLN2_9BACT|nr:glycerol-3-phosphate 1-O-acyltransferase PlsY [Fulvivirga imtechensis]ELR69836.1 Acyl-phosphate:glycerol-3-phosphate O-acyltransferase PlsY [Fulvivirga imtechensis AK7]